jgi:hypothetical protein
VPSSGAPIVFVQLAIERSTVSPTGGSLPSAPGLRSPDQATSWSFLLSLAVLVEPALDDLDAVEVCAVGIAQGIDPETRRRSQP